MLLVVAGLFGLAWLGLAWRPAAIGAPVALAAPAVGSHVGPGCAPGSRTALTHSLVIRQGEWICGDASAIAGDITVLGRVDGNVTALGGAITVAGEVDGNVTDVAGSVTVVHGARVMGNVEAWGGTVHQDTGASVAGGVDRGISVADLAPWHRPFYFSAGGLPWLGVLFWVLAGAVVARFFPRYLTSVERTVQDQPLSSLLVGALALLATVALAILLVATCLGAPLAALLLIVLWASWVVGTVALGLWIGRRVARGMRVDERTVLLLPTLIGVALIAAIEAIPLAGGVVGFVLGCVGLGAVVLTLNGRRQRGAAIARR